MCHDSAANSTDKEPVREHVQKAIQPEFSYGFRLDATKGFVSNLSFLLKQVSSRSNAFELPSSGTRKVVPSPRTSKILATRSFELSRESSSAMVTLFVSAKA
jgi:hypothetical protein